MYSHRPSLPHSIIFFSFSPSYGIKAEASAVSSALTLMLSVKSLSTIPSISIQPISFGSPGQIYMPSFSVRPCFFVWFYTQSIAAPFFLKTSCIFAISALSVNVPSAAITPAAVPAASPVVAHIGIILTDACA